MAEDNKAVNEGQSAATDNQVVPPVTNEDYEARIAELEAEKADLIVSESNYKLGMLKAKGKIKENLEDETEEERIERIVNAKMTSKKIEVIDNEKEALLKKLAKENKELKLAQLNKTTPPASIGTHNESIQVKDTTITSDQMAAFKAKGWTDKDIERYKKNLLKYAGR